MACGVEPSLIAIPVHAERGLVAADVKSFELWAFDQTMRDAGVLLCADLLSGAISPLDDRVVKVAPPAAGSFDDGALVLDGIEPGRGNRVLFVQLFSSPLQRGFRVGVGCVEGATITGGRRTKIDMAIVPSEGL